MTGEDIAEHETIGLAIGFETCQTILSEDPRLLTGERLLQVATHYTSGEIPDKVRLHHAEATLPTRLTTGIRKTIGDSLTRVASQRGVAREAVKPEFDDARTANGLSRRKTAAATARAKETRAKNAATGKGKAKVNGAGTEADPMEIDDDDEDGRGDTPATTAFAGPGLGGRQPIPTPYGLGKPQVVRDSERVIPDSEESEEEL